MKRILGLCALIALCTLGFSSLFVYGQSQPQPNVISSISSEALIQADMTSGERS